MSLQIIQRHSFWYIAVVLRISLIMCLENGAARTPPMGWLAWERFQCNTNCATDPYNCISEDLFMEMADKLVSEGYKDAGYEYINIDDCWMSKERDKNGNMVADPIRFRRGIRYLANYMHARGLKLGIYQDFGFKTCMGYPGVIGHMEEDVIKFAEWDVDMVKLDGCHSHRNELDNGYVTFGKYLRKHFKKPVLYSCSWPYYQWSIKQDPNYRLISTNCNMWRNFHDIQDDWQVIQYVIDFYGDNQETILNYTGPGRWSDPDMLTLGQSRAQMAVWAMIPGPLLMSNDLRKMSNESKAILLNKKVIAVNQDPLGKAGRRIYKENKLEVWKRPIMSSQRRGKSFAILFLNTDKDKECMISSPLSKLGLTSDYLVTDLFKDIVIGTVHSNEAFPVTVSPMDVAMFTFDFIYSDGLVLQGSAP